MRFWRIAAVSMSVAGVLVLMVGCGSGSSRLEVIPVSGKVTYKGQPVAGATVSFMSDKAPRSAVGVTNESGEFRLTTYDTNDGAVAGKHKVTITKPLARSENLDALSPEERGKKMAEMMAKMAQQSRPKAGQPAADLDQSIPAKYADPAVSGLTREVVKGDVNEFTIELTD